MGRRRAHVGERQEREDYGENDTSGSYKLEPPQDAEVDSGIHSVLRRSRIADSERAQIQPNSGRPVRDPQFSVSRGKVKFDGMHRDVELARDLSIRAPTRCVLENLGFSV